MQQIKKTVDVACCSKVVTQRPLTDMVWLLQSRFIMALLSLASMCKMHGMALC